MVSESRERILVISGVYDVVLQAHEALQTTGLVLQSAYSHRDAIYAVEHERFDLALVDGGMRDPVTGQSTCAALARQADLPLIVLGGYGAEQPNPQVEMVIGAIDVQTIRRSIFSVLRVAMTEDGSVETRSRVEEVETLFALGKSLTEVLDLSEVLNRVVAAARHLTGAEEGMILLPDDEKGQLYLRARVGIDDEVARNFRIKTEDTLAGEVLRTGQPTLIGARGPQKVKTQYFVNSLLYVPILLKGHAIGVLGVNNRTNDDVFNIRHQQLLMNLASYAAIAIENARAHEEALQRTRELQSLVQASQVVNSSVALNQTLPNICEQLVKVLHVNWSSIYEWDRAANTLGVLARYQQSLWPGEGGQHVLSLDRHPTLNRALVEGAPVFMMRHESLAADEAALMRRDGVEALWIVPVWIEESVLGAARIHFIAAPASEPPAEVLQHVQHLALEALMALLNENARTQSDHLFRLAREINALLEADWCEFALYTPQALVTRVSAGRGVWVDRRRPLITLDRYPDLATIVNNRAVLVAKAEGGGGAGPLLALTHSGSILGLPLIQRGQAQGVVLFGDVRSNRAFTEREIDLARALVAQAAIALENARLVHDLASSLDELRDAQERLIEAARLSAMGELAAAVAHQINNPLTTILVDTELMLLDEPPNSRNHKSLLAMSRAGKRAASVVRRLLATARPIEENAPLEPIDVVDSIEGILSLVKSHIEQDRIQIITRLPQERLPPVWAAQGALDDVWLNLLLNAHDALIGHPDAQITIEALYDAGRSYLDVVVWDNGPGIAPAIQPQIFDAFFTTKPVGEGTGLGLHICRQVVERIGGSITLESHEAQGARFQIRLPIRKGGA